MTTRLNGIEEHGPREESLAERLLPWAVHLAAAAYLLWHMARAGWLG